MKKARRIGEPFSIVLLLRETGYGLVGRDSFSIGVLNLDATEGDVLGIVHLGTLAADKETVLHLQVAERHLGQTVEPHGTSCTLTDNVGDIEVAETWSLLGHGRNSIGAGSVLVAVANDGFVGIIEVEGESVGSNVHHIDNVLGGKLMCVLTKGKVNPMIGAAGVSAVPMAARVVHKEGLREDPTNFLLMHAMGPNVAGVIGSAVAAGVLLLLFA